MSQISSDELKSMLERCNGNTQDSEAEQFLENSTNNIQNLEIYQSIMGDISIPQLILDITLSARIYKARGLLLKSEDLKAHSLFYIEVLNTNIETFASDPRLSNSISNIIAVTYISSILASNSFFHYEELFEQLSNTQIRHIIIQTLTEIIQEIKNLPNETKKTIKKYFKNFGIFYKYFEVAAEFLKDGLEAYSLDLLLVIFELLDEDGGLSCIGRGIDKYYINPEWLQRMINLIPIETYQENVLTVLNFYINGIEKITRQNKMGIFRVVLTNLLPVLFDCANIEYASKVIDQIVEQVPFEWFLEDENFMPTYEKLLEYFMHSIESFEASYVLKAIGHINEMVLMLRLYNVSSKNSIMKNKSITIMEKSEDVFEHYINFMMDNLPQCLDPVYEAIFGIEDEYADALRHLWKLAYGQFEKATKYFFSVVEQVCSEAGEALISRSAMLFEMAAGLFLDLPNGYSYAINRSEYNNGIKTVAMSMYLLLKYAGPPSESCSGVAVVMERCAMFMCTKLYGLMNNNKVRIKLWDELSQIDCDQRLLNRLLRRPLIALHAYRDQPDFLEWLIYQLESFMKGVKQRYELQKNKKVSAVDPLEIVSGFGEMEMNVFGSLIEKISSVFTLALSSNALEGKLDLFDEIFGSLEMSNSQEAFILFKQLNGLANGVKEQAEKLQTLFAVWVIAQRERIIDLIKQQLDNIDVISAIFELLYSTANLDFVFPNDSTNGIDLFEITADALLEIRGIESNEQKFISIVNPATLAADKKYANFGIMKYFGDNRIDVVAEMFFEMLAEIDQNADGEEQNSYYYYRSVCGIKAFVALDNSYLEANMPLIVKAIAKSMFFFDTMGRRKELWDATCQAAIEVIKGIPEGLFENILPIFVLLMDHAINDIENIRITAVALEKAILYAPDNALEVIGSIKESFDEVMDSGDLFDMFLSRPLDFGGELYNFSKKAVHYGVQLVCIEKFSGLFCE